MPNNTESTGGTFKEWFNADLYHSIADSFEEHVSEFDRKQFLALTIEGIEGRELMDRLRQTSRAAQASLPGDYPAQLEVLCEMAEPLENGLIGCWYSDFVGQFGTAHPEISLPALAHLTQFGSAEFAIREFILRYPEQTLSAMEEWTQHDNEHVRRLASEGARPRLPWGKRLDLLIKDPSPTRQILSNLRDDPAIYVRKSVANHLNDITKDHSEYVLDLVTGWDRSSPRTSWIVKQGLRTLIKQGNPRALDLMGVGKPAELAEISFSVSPAHILFGDTIQLELQLKSSSKATQDLMIDYIVHYVKASGRTQPKVFKWKRVSLAGRESLSLAKRQTIKDFSTRKHYAGHHKVEIQVNGQRVAEAGFDLSN